MPHPNTYLPIHERFERFVSPEPMSGCHLWTGARRHYGYGSFTVKRRMVSAHRVSWMLSFGPIPEAMDVLHRCDNPACVNPAHLFLGTHDDNMRDRALKGREIIRRGAQHGRSTHPERTARGDRHGGAKLNEELVRQIRQRRAAGEGTRALAREVGVHEETIRDIVSRRRWSHVT